MVYVTRWVNIFAQKMILSIHSHESITLGGLLSTPKTTAPIVGIAFIVLFAVIGLMVGPDYDGMNSPALPNSKGTNKIWLIYIQGLYL